MRDTFISTLSELARKDSRIILITGDLGFKVFDQYRTQLPNQFLNAGVAEQNMIGLAAGLAFEGFIPVVYSIANFPSLRCLEQIRNDVCYHNLNVKIVSVGAGFSYGQLGSSHHATEDIACLRAIPNLSILNPGSDLETRSASTLMLEATTPFYLRLDREGAHDTRPDIHFELGGARRIKDGTDASILTTGGILKEVNTAAAQLESQGISVRVTSFPSIVPLNLSALKLAVESTNIIVTIEEHTLAGGFGSIVSEMLCDAGITAKHFSRIGIPRVFADQVGDQDFLRGVYGLQASDLSEHILKLVAK